jgi:hypothetical protein
MQRARALCSTLPGVACPSVNPVRKHRTTDGSTNAHGGGHDAVAPNRQDITNERVVRRRPSKPHRLRVFRAWAQGYIRRVDRRNYGQVIELRNTPNSGRHNSFR